MVGIKAGINFYRLWVLLPYLYGSVSSSVTPSVSLIILLVTVFVDFRVFVEVNDERLLEGVIVR